MIPSLFYQGRDLFYRNICNTKVDSLQYSLQLDPKDKFIRMAIQKIWNY